MLGTFNSFVASFETSAIICRVSALIMVQRLVCNGMVASGKSDQLKTLIRTDPEAKKVVAVFIANRLSTDQDMQNLMSSW